MCTVLSDDEQALRNIAANVKRLLAEQGMLQRELAAAIGESEMFVSHLVNGRHMPGGGALLRIAKALKTTAEELGKAPRKSRRETCEKSR